MFIEEVNTNPPLFHVIDAKSSLDVDIKYSFPQYIIDSKGIGPARLIPTGQYLLKFIYFGSGNNNSWNGAISSNQIQICITD
jgi:hypothetical protein